MLERWKRNEIIEAVEAGGLDKRDCTFDFGDSESRITLPPSESSFLLEGVAGNYTSTMIVGDGVPQPLRHYTWPTVVERCQRWAAEAKRDADTPDLWAELQREREILTGARYEAGENTPFTPDEQAEIAEQLRQIKEYVKKTNALSEAQVRILDARFDELEDAIRHVGRMAWRLMFLGVVLTLFVADIVPPEAVRQIPVTALHSLDHLFGGGSPPQLPPTTPGREVGR
jgi:hypothetical protein